MKQSNPQASSSESPWTSLRELSDNLKSIFWPRGGQVPFTLRFVWHQAAAQSRGGCPCLFMSIPKIRVTVVSWPRQFLLPFSSLCSWLPAVSEGFLHCFGLDLANGPGFCCCQGPPVSSNISPSSQSLLVIFAIFLGTRIQLLMLGLGRL